MYSNYVISHIVYLVVFFVVQIYPGFSFKFLVLLRIIYVMLEHN